MKDRKIKTKIKKIMMRITNTLKNNPTKLLFSQKIKA